MDVTSVASHAHKRVCCGQVDEVSDEDEDEEDEDDDDDFDEDDDEDEKPRRSRTKPRGKATNGRARGGKTTPGAPHARVWGCVWKIKSQDQQRVACGGIDAPGSAPA